MKKQDIKCPEIENLINLANEFFKEADEFIAKRKKLIEKSKE